MLCSQASNSHESQCGTLQLLVHAYLLGNATLSIAHLQLTLGVCYHIHWHFSLFLLEASCPPLFYFIFLFYFFLFFLISSLLLCTSMTLPPSTPLFVPCSCFCNTYHHANLRRISTYLSEQSCCRLPCLQFSPDS